MLVGGGITDVAVALDIRPEGSLGVALSVGSVQLLDLHTVPGQTTHILRPIKDGAPKPDAALLLGNVQIKPVTTSEDILVTMEALPVQVRPRRSCVVCVLLCWVCVCMQLSSPLRSPSRARSSTAW